MISAATSARIHRLRASIGNGKGLGYAQAEHDVKALLGELERVREDNDVLRKRHAALWSVANGPDPTRRFKEAAWQIGLIAMGAIAICGIAALVVSLGRLAGP